MTKQEYRIGLCGCAGMGKTSLAEALSTALKVPLLKSREITEDILKRDGYNYSSGIQIERFLANSGRQNEILRRTLEQQKSVPEFVTDRTLIDLAAYAVCELHHSDVMAVRRIMDTCRVKSVAYTHLFLCPWKDEPVADNKRRTLNPWYQYLVHALERGILDDWGIQYFVLEDMTTPTRVVKIRSILGLE